MSFVNGTLRGKRKMKITNKTLVFQFLNLGEIKESIDGQWTAEIGFWGTSNRVQEADKFRENLTSEFIEIKNNESILSTRN